MKKNIAPEGTNYIFVDLLFYVVTSFLDFHNGPVIHKQVTKQKSKCKKYFFLLVYKTIGSNFDGLCDNVHTKATITLFIIHFLYKLYILYFQKQVVPSEGATLHVTGHVSSFLRAANNKVIYI